MSSPILFGRITSERSRFAWSGAAGILGCVLCGLRLRLSAASRGVGRANFCRQRALALFHNNNAQSLAWQSLSRRRQPRSWLHSLTPHVHFRRCSQVIHRQAHTSSVLAVTASERRSSSRSTTTTTTTTPGLVTAGDDFCTRQTQHYTSYLAYS